MSVAPERYSSKLEITRLWYGQAGDKPRRCLPQEMPVAFAGAVAVDSRAIDIYQFLSIPDKLIKN